MGRPGLEGRIVESQTSFAEVISQSLIGRRGVLKGIALALGCSVIGAGKVLFSILASPENRLRVNTDPILKRINILRSGLSPENIKNGQVSGNSMYSLATTSGNGKGYSSGNGVVVLNGGKRKFVTVSHLVSLPESSTYIHHNISGEDYKIKEPFSIGKTIIKSGNDQEALASFDVDQDELVNSPGIPIGKFNPNEPIFIMNSVIGREGLKGYEIRVGAGEMRAVSSEGSMGIACQQVPMTPECSAVAKTISQSIGIPCEAKDSGWKRGVSGAVALQLVVVKGGYEFRAIGVASSGIYDDQQHLETGFSDRVAIIPLEGNL